MTEISHHVCGFRGRVLLSDKTARLSKMKLRRESWIFRVLRRIFVLFWLKFSFFSIISVFFCKIWVILPEFSLKNALFSDFPKFIEIRQLSPIIYGYVAVLCLFFKISFVIRLFSSKITKKKRILSQKTQEISKCSKFLKKKMEKLLDFQFFFQNFGFLFFDSFN